MSDLQEQMRREYNVAIANGLVLKARMLDRRLRSLQARSEDDG